MTDRESAERDLRRAVEILDALRTHQTENRSAIRCVYELLRSVQRRMTAPATRAPMAPTWKN